MQQYYLIKNNIRNEIPFDLLLLADESKEAIEQYIYRSSVYLLKDRQHVTVAVIALYQEDKNTLEIKNIAVAQHVQHKGIGSFLIDQVKKMRTMRSISVAAALCCLLMTTRVSAQDNQQKAAALQQAVNKYLYESNTGLYLETSDRTKNHNPHSYLWGLCGLIQAANEMEALYPGRQYMQRKLHRSVTLTRRSRSVRPCESMSSPDWVISPADWSRHRWCLRG